MKTIDERLVELADQAIDEADTFRDMLENEGGFRGIRRRTDGAVAIFKNDEAGLDDDCRVQAIFDLAAMLKREPEVKG